MIVHTVGIYLENGGGAMGFPSWAEPNLRRKNGRLGVTRIPGFVTLQKICSPIRLQDSSGLSGC